MSKLAIFKVIIFIFILSLNDLAAQSNNPRGFTGGLNFSNIMTTEVFDSKVLINSVLGVFYAFRADKEFSIRPEFLISSKSTEYSGIDYYTGEYFTNSSTLHYFEVPVLVVIAVDDNFNILGGPYIEFFISGSLSVTRTNTTGYYSSTINESNDLGKDYMNSPGYGIILGLEYKIGSSNLSLRYSAGLSSVFDENHSYIDKDVKHSIIQLILGVDLVANPKYKNE